MMRAFLLLALVACSAPATPAPAPAPASGWEQRFAEHDGVRVEYRVRSGRGVPVVFVPGMSNSACEYESSRTSSGVIHDA